MKTLVTNPDVATLQFTHAELAAMLAVFGAAEGSDAAKSPHFNWAAERINREWRRIADDRREAVRATNLAAVPAIPRSKSTRKKGFYVVNDLGQLYQGLFNAHTWVKAGAGCDPFVFETREQAESLISAYKAHGARTVPVGTSK